MSDFPNESLRLKESIKARKLIVYELNEVSNETILRYCQERPESFLSRFIQNSVYTPTISHDGGELHPWSTWPTVHRGVTNEAHGINYINQDLSSPNKHYPTIWSEVLSKGLTIGIWGSLQSYPPLRGPGVKFYVPDTFSPDPITLPKRLEHLQGINIYATKMGHGNSDLIGSREVRERLLRSICTSILNNTFSKGSLFSSARQITREMGNAAWNYNRPTLQAKINFNAYYKYLTATKPDFSTFFTNHVASLQHRLWAYFHGQEGNVQERRAYSKIFKAGMDETSREIGLLMKTSARHGYDIAMVSSMSQAPIKERCCSLSIIFKDIGKFRQFFHLPPTLIARSSMFPDFAFSVEEEYKAKCQEVFLSLTDKSGRSLFTLKRTEPSLDQRCTFFLSQNGDLDISDGYLFSSGTRIRVGDIGLKVAQRLPGTAYHAPEGVLYWYSNNYRNSSLASKSEQPLPTDQIKQLMTSHLLHISL